MTSKSLRAASVAALFVLFSSNPSAGGPKKSETYNDIIEKAYNLSLQKDRQQAIGILSKAILKENRVQAALELKRAAIEVTHVFYSDKTQQLFEAGISFRRTELKQALEKINEALKSEPGNVAIGQELARILIAKGDCASAEDLLAKHLPELGFDEELRLGYAQALVCQQKWVEYQKVYEMFASKKSPLQQYWLTLDIMKNLSRKNYVKAHEQLSALKKIDIKNPAAYYWGWKLAQLQNKVAIEDARKYVMTCKNISTNQFREYMIDPMLCRFVSEVESETKGLDSANI